MTSVEFGRSSNAFLSVRKGDREVKDEKKGPSGKLQMGNELDDYDCDAGTDYEEFQVELASGYMSGYNTAEIAIKTTIECVAETLERSCLMTREGRGCSTACAGLAAMPFMGGEIIVPSISS